MPVERTVDEFGDGMTLLKTKNGKWKCVAFSEEALNSVKSLPLRDDDVMLCSYAKAGCHWTWEIIRCLVSGRTAEDGPDVVHKESLMMEVQTREKLNPLPSPRILNNHLTFEEQPDDLLKKPVKVVYVYRNVKDIAVSFYHHISGIQKAYDYTGTFSRYLKRFSTGFLENGSVFEYMTSWEKAILAHPELNVHVMSYEGLKQDALGEIRRLSQFLGTSTEEKFLAQVAAYTQIDTMRDRKTQGGKDIQKMLINKEGKHVMYRKGEVGDWQNHFTVAESRWFDQLIETHLGDLKLHTFNYELPL